MYDKQKYKEHSSNPSQINSTLSFLLFNVTFYIHSYIQIINEFLFMISHTLNVYKALNANL